MNLSLSYLPSLCEEEVWRVTFFYTVVSCVSNFPLDSDNGRTYYMLRVMAVVRAVATLQFSAVRRTHRNSGYLGNQGGHNTMNYVAVNEGRYAVVSTSSRYLVQCFSPSLDARPFGGPK